MQPRNSQAHQRNYSGPPPGGASLYFTEFTVKKAALYFIAALYVISMSILALIEPWMDLPCPTSVQEFDEKFENPGFAMHPCRSVIRYSALLWFTRNECSFARCMVAALLLGGVIGWERRQADRPAGIRTMALVSLGSCLFTINSAFAFVNSPMNWDASRISAAIPSGVGFLGAGLIFKKEDSETGSNVVHGLTTAASVWLSAAVGIACGGELYMPASFGTALIMLLLRFGPRATEGNIDETHPSTIIAKQYQERMNSNSDVHSDHLAPRGLPIEDDIEASERTPLADNARLDHDDMSLTSMENSSRKRRDSNHSSVRSRAALSCDL